jgi:hypothetical protein
VLCLAEFRPKSLDRLVHLVLRAPRVDRGLSRVPCSQSNENLKDTHSLAFTFCRSAEKRAAGRDSNQTTGSAS